MRVARGTHILQGLFPGVFVCRSSVPLRSYRGFVTGTEEMRENFTTSDGKKVWVGTHAEVLRPLPPRSLLLRSPPWNPPQQKSSVLAAVAVSSEHPSIRNQYMNGRMGSREDSRSTTLTGAGWATLSCCSSSCALFSACLAFSAALVSANRMCFVRMAGGSRRSIGSVKCAESEQEEKELSQPWTFSTFAGLSSISV